MLIFRRFLVRHFAFCIFVVFAVLGVSEATAQDNQMASLMPPVPVPPGPMQAETAVVPPTIRMAQSVNTEVDSLPPIIAPLERQADANNANQFFTSEASYPVANVTNVAASSPCDGGQACGNGVCNCGNRVGGNAWGRKLPGAGGPFYLSLDFGWSAAASSAENLSMGKVFPPAIDIKDSQVTRVGIGKYFGDWRVEGEVGFRKYEVDDVKLFQDDYFLVQGERSTTSLMANFFYDLNISGILRPYAKFGLGSSYNEAVGSRFVNPLASNVFFGDVYPKGESWEFAWSVGCGFGICLTHSLFLDLEYQYIEMGSVATGYNRFGSAQGFGQGHAHEFTTGLRVNF